MNINTVNKRKKIPSVLKINLHQKNFTLTVVLLVKHHIPRDLNRQLADDDDDDGQHQMRKIIINTILFILFFFFACEFVFWQLWDNEGIFNYISHKAPLLTPAVPTATHSKVQPQLIERLKTEKIGVSILSVCSWLLLS